MLNLHHGGIAKLLRSREVPVKTSCYVVEKHGRCAIQNSFSSGRVERAVTATVQGGIATVGMVLTALRYGLQR